MPPEIKRWIPLVCVLVFCYFLWSSAHPTLSVPQERPTEKMKSPKKLKEYVYPKGLRDPFGAPTAVVEEKPVEEKVVKKKRVQTMHINGIIWDAHMPLVSVNGHLLSEGSSWGEGRVIKIHPDKVEVEVRGRVFEKYLSSFNREKIQ